MFRTLTDHQAIRAWAASREIDPAIIPLIDEPALELVSDHPDAMPVRDRLGRELVRWETWFAELDRQNLALRVREGDRARPYEFVPREREFA